MVLPIAFGTFVDLFSNPIATPNFGYVNQGFARQALNKEIAETVERYYNNGHPFCSHKTDHNNNSLRNGCNLSKICPAVE
jgi:hypothetical protein